jgi:N-acetylglucosamine-6-phosphate deacetylase
VTSAGKAGERAALRGRAVIRSEVVEAKIVVEDDRIASVDPLAASEDGTVEQAIIPGFIDVHVHGAGGFDAMDGPDEIRGMARVLARRGVTAFLPTSVSASLDRLAAFASDVRLAREGQDEDRSAGLLPAEAAILGAHLEGPCLAPDYRGAHDAASLVSPSEFLATWESEPDRWDEVRIVTLAPELPTGLELVARLAADGRVASVGHTGASFEEAWGAFQAGARSATHLFNRMPPVHHRAPGAAIAALTHPGTSVELIVDGFHVASELWPVVWATARERLVIVSDAVRQADAGGGPAMLANGTIAGSTMLLDGALRRVLEAGMPLARACQALSTRPAELAGTPGRGRIAVGSTADLLLVEPDGAIARVLLGGRWLDEAAPGPRAAR